MKVLILYDDEAIFEDLSKLCSEVSTLTITLHYVYNAEIFIEEFNSQFTRKFFIVLTCFQAHFIHNTYAICNAINNLNRPEEYAVNRNTVFFNVFLEIPKIVALSNRDELENISEYKRVDVYAPHNYALANLFNSNKQQYYILHYDVYEKFSKMFREILQLLM
ncbi:MAG: hypothetical protein MUE53_02460 [Chitinophagales bacterium]|jgi:hypothetical protein|nr:hypothetical protein [Chitinophagales bacterium]